MEGSYAVTGTFLVTVERSKAFTEEKFKRLVIFIPVYFIVVDFCYIFLFCYQLK
jgi:hypothetical protein